VIETPRLLIRLAEDRDAEPFLAIHTDPDVIRWLGGPRPKTVGDELERIARRRTMQEELGFTMWTVEERATNEVVGLAGLFPVEEIGDEIEVAYHFRKDRWGRGYATEAAQACLDYGFEAARLPRVVGLVAPQNTASARVLEKCGMELVGPARHYGMDLLKYALERPGAGSAR
jgi:ribosomal-protein-alanine N-acetyltransferase